MTAEAVTPTLLQAHRGPAPPSSYQDPADVVGVVPKLQSLVQAGVLNGFGLVSVQGVVGPVVGAELQLELLAEEPRGTDSGTCSLPPGALQFLKPFNTVPQPGVGELFTVAGSKLLVVQRSAGCVAAVGPRRALNVAALQLQPGLVLVVSWGRCTFPQTALTRLHAALGVGL